MGPLSVARADSTASLAASTKRTKAEGKATEVDSSHKGEEDDQPRKKARTPAKAEQSKQKKPRGKFFVLERLPLEMIHEVRPSPLVPLARRLAS